MTNVGTISVLITARTGQFTKGITQATAALNTFARNAGRIAGAITAPTKNVEGLGSALSKNQSKLTDFGMTGVQAGKQMGQMGTGMGKAANAIGNNVGKAQNSLLSFQSFIGKISHYITFSIGVQMVMGIKRGFQSLIDTTIEFEKQAVRTAGVAGRLGGAFDKTVENLQQVSRTLGATTIFFATDAVNSMYDLASAGFDIAGAMEDVTNGVNVMTPILEYAAAQQIELADATESVAKALKMFDEDLSATKSTVDTFTAAISNSFLTADKLSDALRYSGAMAHTLGLNLQETVAGAMALADAGLTGAQSGQRLNMILTKLIDPTEEAKRTLARLGLTIEDINPELHSFTEILYTLEAAGFKAADAATMFRARTAGAAAMLVNSADAVGQYIRVLNGASNITSELAEKQRDTLWGTLKLVAAAFQDVGINAGQMLIPAIKTLASFARDVLVPILKVTVDSLRFMANILAPLAPAFKSLLIGVTLAAAAFIAFKIATLGATKSLITMTVAMATNPVFLLITALVALAGIIVHLMKKFDLIKPLMDTLGSTWEVLSDAVMGFIDTIRPAAEQIAKFIWLISPLGMIIKGLQVAFGEFNAELVRARKFYDQVSDEVKEYETSLGALEDKLEEQKRLEEEIIELQKDETSSIDELSEKKGKLKEVTEEVEATEKDFLATTTELVREIQKLSEDLDIYANKFADIIEISNKITNAEADRADVEEEIIDLQEEYNKAVVDYGLTSLEATEILSKLADKEQEIIKIDKQIAELSGDKTEAIHEEEKQLNRLNSTERTYADIIQTVLDGENKLSDLRVKKAKLAAKQNVLISTRNKFEGYFEEQVDALRDAETKLYEIEAKLYQLRYGQIDSYRDLFDAIASQGVASKEVIEAYRNMEISQGKAKKEQIDYSKVLERLSDANREKAMEWTQAYVEAVSDGATHSEAMIKANSELGYTLSNVSGVTNSVRKEIMEYAEAQGLANRLASEFRGTSLSLAEDLVNSGQASTDVAKAYYTLLKNSNSLEKGEDDLIKVEDDAVDTSKDLIKTTGRLYNYYENIEGLEDDRTGIVMNMVDAMDLSNRAGETQADVLDNLNYFYGTNKESLEEFDEAEVVAALSAMKLADSLDYLKGKKLTKDDILPELPLDDWDTFISLAYDTAQEQNVFDDLTSSLTGLDEDIAALVDSLSGFDDIILGLTIDNPADEPTWWEGVKSTFQAGWKSILEGTDPLGIGAWWSGVTETLSKGWENITKGLDPLNIKDLFVGGFKWFTEQLINSANGIITVGDMIAGGFGWLKDRLVDTLTGIIDIGSMITGGVSGAVDTVSGWFGGLFGEKGIVAAARGITETRGPTPAIIGENGAEAVVPLQGINRRNGLEILKRIIPEYFPELTPMEAGSIVSSSYGGVKTNPSGPATVVQGNKEYHIHGDINVYGVQDVGEFMDELMRELEERKRMVE